jgi:UDP-N-acetylmuramoyl-L-alanyl-D-glutamate--2,6-diaminopimelate ligase
MRRSLAGVLSIAVTGTKGKTSTTEFIARLIEASGLVTAFSSGESAQIGRRRVTVCDTGLDIARLVSRCRRVGVECVAVELSSSMLTWNLHRGFELDAAVVTNIGTDHIQDHGNKRNYIAVKRRLVRGLRATPNSPNPVVVLNADDRAVAGFRQGLAPGVTACVYGLRRPAISAGRSVWASDIVHQRDGTSFLVHGLADGPLPCRTSLHGDFNVSNVLAAVACVVMLGANPRKVVAAARSLTPPAGRFQVVAASSRTRPTVVVDYAHTPESLESALIASRALAPAGRVHAVFGCGGDCYKKKRGMMGRVAAGRADTITLTSDNPRSEDPGAIARSILAGIPARTRRNVRVELDRARAIREAIRRAAPGDVVAILGKGAERTQEINGRKHLFSDVAIARAALRASGGGR